MENEYLKTEKEIIDKLKESLTPDNGYSFDYEPKYFTSRRRAYTPDLLIRKDGNPIAMVEIKLNINTPLLLNLQSWLQEVAAGLGTRYIILTDGTSAYFIDVRNIGESNNWEPFDLTKLCQQIEQIEEDNIKLGPYKSVAELNTSIKDALKADNSSDYEFINSFLDKNEDPAIIFNASNGFDFSEEFKNLILDSMESHAENEELCRYTSLSTLFRQISNDQHSMASLEGMNDTTEIKYVDDCFEASKEAKKSHEKHNDDFGNNYFILSLCAKEQIDNLTLWRLYGDDSKGVCIVYEPVSKKLPEGFKMKKVIYDDKLLHILKKIIDRISPNCEENQAKKNKTVFYYVSTDDAWKHFFKPKEYKTEKEIRLLLDKRDAKSSFIETWVHNTTYNIIHPILLFDKLQAENKFPLKIKEIILGPNMPEAELNQKQLTKLLKSKGLNIQVRLSDIRVYRAQ